MTVRSRARGQGAGRALIQAVHGQAKATGSPRVYWHTHESNTAAMKLYNKVAEKSGFLVYRQTVRCAANRGERSYSGNFNFRSNELYLGV